MTDTITLELTHHQLKQLACVLRYYLIRFDGNELEMRESGIELLLKLDRRDPARLPTDPWPHTTSYLLAALSDHYDELGKPLPRWLDDALAQEAI